MFNQTQFRGQPCVELSLPEGDRIRIALHGAHILSWVTADGAERLYLNPKAVFDGNSPIRGGIPLCFPQFNQRALGAFALPKHGFARISTWSVQEPSDDGAIGEISLSWRSDAATLLLWPGEFEATLTVVLAPGILRVIFGVKNTGKAAFSFALALHTYLQVDDIAGVRLDGLGGLSYWDAVRDLKSPEIRQQQAEGMLTFDGETDRVYEGVLEDLALRYSGGAIGISQSDELKDVVVWNPGQTLCAALTDMPADGYRHMLCVEAARINEPVLLQPGQAWSGWQELRLLA